MPFVLRPMGTEIPIPMAICEQSVAHRCARRKKFSWAGSNLFIPAQSVPQHRRICVPADAIENSTKKAKEPKASFHGTTPSLESRKVYPSRPFEIRLGFFKGLLPLSFPSGSDASITRGPKPSTAELLEPAFLEPFLGGAQMLYSVLCVLHDKGKSVSRAFICSKSEVNSCFPRRERYVGK